MQKIRSINMWKLLKLELPDLAERVIGVLDEHAPELLKIKEGYDLLVQQQPQINILRLVYGPHLETKKVNVLRVKRSTFASLIVNQVRALSRTEIEGGVANVILARSVVDLYLVNLRKMNEKEINQTLLEFFREIDANEAVEDAFTSIGVSKYLDGLRSSHAAIEEGLGVRKKSIASRPTVNIPPIANSIRYSLRNMFLHINVAQMQNKALDYSLLIADLNSEIKEFTSLISMRATAAKKKKEAELAKGVDVVIEKNGEGSEVPEQPVVETAVKMRPLNVEETASNGIGFGDKPLEKEKLAATSSKTTQVPPINNEEEKI